MWFSRKQVAILPPDGVKTLSGQVTTKSKGDAAELAALAFLLKAGLTLIEKNYNTPGRGGGEIDLVMRAVDGTLVFVEVRLRSSTAYGGAAASISAVKQQRIVFAARHYLMRFASFPPCRFDVVLVSSPAPQVLSGKTAGLQIEWLPAAFDAS